MKKQQNLIQILSFLRWDFQGQSPTLCMTAGWRWKLFQSLKRRVDALPIWWQEVVELLEISGDLKNVPGCFNSKISVNESMVKEEWINEQNRGRKEESGWNKTQKHIFRSLLDVSQNSTRTSSTLRTMLQ